MTPLKVKDITDTQKFRLVTHRFPENSPIFEAMVGKEAFVVDLKAQSFRPLKPDALPTSISFIKLKSGQLLIAYADGRKTLTVEDAASGKLIESLELSKLFPGVQDHNLPGNPQLYEDSDGHLKVFIEGTNLYGRLVYDVATKKAFIANRITSPGDKWEGRSFPLIVSPASGRVLARAQGGANTIILELFEGGSKILVHEPKEMDSSQFNEFHEILPNGRTIFYIYDDQNGFILHDIDHTTSEKIISVESGSLSPWPLKIIESPDGDLKILSKLKKQDGKDSVLAVIDMNSKIEEISLPGTSQIGLKNVTGPAENFPQFQPLNLRDGRTLLVGLAAKSDSATPEYAATKLYVIDRSNKALSLFDVSRFNVGHLVGTYETEDGRIIGVFTRNRKLMTLQIFGPVPGGSP